MKTVRIAPSGNGRTHAPVTLDSLLRRADLWRGRQRSHKPAGQDVSTGFPELDARLPGGGWPRGALTEILAEYDGIGELHLVLPTLARITQSGRWIAWIEPPHIPYAPALATAGLDLTHCLFVVPERRSLLWTLEQTLRNGACGAVLGWPDKATTPRHLRRLQLAAEEGNALAFLFRDPHTAAEHSPAALRLRLTGGPHGPEVEIIKCRGSWERGPLHLAIA